jgi:1-acyl-sn-glycerol-3-phosphate acyltransferase
MSIRREIKLLRHGRDWRGRSTVPQSAEPHMLEQEGREFPTAWARTRVAVTARKGLRRTLLKPVAFSQTNAVVEGTEYLDGVRGPVVFVANHSSHLDTPLILGSLPERFADRVAVGAASDYFFDVRWRAALTAVFFNAFPVERYGSRRLRSLALDLVDDGWSLLLYPEGTRSEDGWINPFKLGAAMLCVTKGIPCVPMTPSTSQEAPGRFVQAPSWSRPARTARRWRTGAASGHPPSHWMTSAAASGERDRSDPRGSPPVRSQPGLPWSRTSGSLRMPAGSCCR